MGQLYLFLLTPDNTDERFVSIMSCFADSSWRFGRSDGSYIAELLLTRGGRISGSRSSNESYWIEEGSVLTFLDEHKRESTRFDLSTIIRGRRVLRGAFLLRRSALLHELVEAVSIAELHKRSQTINEITDLNGSNFRIRATSRVVAALERLGVYFGRNANRHRPESFIEIPFQSELEPYSSFSEGHAICSMGAFSYAESPVPVGLKVGRYCSIATGLEIFRDRHPIEWTTTSSITYDAHPSSGYRSFIAAHAEFGLHGLALHKPPHQSDPLPVIENDVWIGQHVQLARGINIATGSVIAAGAVVTKDVAPYAIVGGIPAKIIKYRFDDNVIDRLLTSRWWSFEPTFFAKSDFKNPKAFLEHLDSLGGRDKAIYAPRYIWAEDLINNINSVPTLID